MRKTVCAAFAACVLAGAGPVPAWAQTEADASQMTEWGKMCTPGKDGQLCIVRRDVAGKDGKLDASVSIQVPPADGKSHMTLVVPTGTLVARGLMLQVDGGSPMTVPFRYCRDAFCHVEVSVGAPVVDALKGGLTFSLTRYDTANQAHKVDVSLKGFTKASEGEGITPAAMETAQ